MATFLLRHLETSEEEREVETETGKEIRRVKTYKNRFEKVTGKIEDFPGYAVITLHQGTPKEVTVLMARSGIPAGTSSDEPWTCPRDTTGLVEALCRHGLLEHPEGRPLRRGWSWVPGRYLEAAFSSTGLVIVKCVICWGEVRPADFRTDVVDETTQA